MKSEIKVSGMHCSACEQLISEELIDNGAKKVDADFKSGMVSVEHDGSLPEDHIKKIIIDEGYGVEE